MSPDNLEKFLKERRRAITTIRIERQSDDARDDKRLKASIAVFARDLTLTSESRRGAFTSRASLDITMNRIPRNQILIRHGADTSADELVDA
jgi:hypothetical protein